MEKLNLRSPKPYDYTAESETFNARINFFCVAEGPTEESYFLGIRNNRGTLNIKNDVHIEVISKSEGQESFSHPKQLVYACLRAMGRIDENNHEIPKEQWEKKCLWEEYDPEVDIVCVIFDRDYRQLEQHLDEIFELCEKHEIQIVMSNPNFELWLLMHYPNIEQYDKELLLKNPKNLRGQLFEKASTKKKYLEILLSSVADGYVKGCKIRFERFLPGIPLAMQQAEAFCEDPQELQAKLGSSVGRLIRKMKE